VLSPAARGEVHGVDQTEAFLHAALAHEIGHGVGDVREAAPVGDFKPQVLGQPLHRADMPRAGSRRPRGNGVAACGRGLEIHPVLDAQSAVA
jgi:hypothetical protein